MNKILLRKYLIIYIINHNFPGKGIISGKNRNLFEVWNKNDPVDEWECERARRIEKIQGNRNKLVLAKC